jgi:hypothetical protein
VRVSDRAKGADDNKESHAHRTSSSETSGTRASGTRRTAAAPSAPSPMSAPGRTCKPDRRTALGADPWVGDIERWPA